MTKKYSLSAVKNEEIIIGACDTETRGLGGDLLFITSSLMGENKEFGGNELGLFIDYLLTAHNPVIWYLHNAQYDWRYIIPELLERDYEIDFALRTDTDIYQIKFRPKGVKSWVIMRDSFALYPAKLKKFLEAFAPNLPKLEIDNIENFDPNNPDHRAYAMRDSVGLCEAIKNLNGMLYTRFCVGIGHTTAGTALKAWQSTLNKTECYSTSKWGAREAFIRQAYFGGLVFLTDSNLYETKDNKPIAKTYDINSSYPSVMCDYGVPAGSIVESRDYQTGKLGIYRVLIKAPENIIIPIIPSRNEKGGLIWRGGTFETVVTSSELIFATRHGYEIIDIFEGFYFTETIFPFNDFINKCKLIRKEFKGKSEEQLAKLMQNSVYGKFGSKRERASIIKTDSLEESEGMIQLGDYESLWVTKDFDEEMKCKPEWAVFITAHARLKLLKTAYDVGVGNVLYGDTDSLTIIDNYDLIDSGPEYGQFKLEKEWRSFRAIAPKVYSGVLMSGLRLGAIKGVSRKAMTEQKWEELETTGTTSGAALSLQSLKTGLKRGMKPAQILERKSSDIKNSENWKKLDNGKIRVRIA